MYRGCEPVYEVEYEPEEHRTIVEAVVDALSQAEGVDPTELPPLYDVVDTDALNRLFDPRDRDSVAATFSFTVRDWNVFVRGDGRVLVCDATRTVDPTPVFETQPV